MKHAMRYLLVLAAATWSAQAAAQLELSGDAEAKADAQAEATAPTTAEAEAASEPTVGEDVTAPAAEPAAAPAPAPMDELDEPAAAPAGGTAGFDKGFFIRTNDGNYLLKIRGGIKGEWLLRNEETQVMGDNGEPGRNHTLYSSFAAPYARLNFSGNLVSPKLKYMLEYDFATTSLIYAFSTWTFIPEVLQIQVGLFKRPISRQFNTSSRARYFARAPLGDFVAGYGTGIEVSNNYKAAKGLEWAVGVFNGHTLGLAAPPQPFNEFAPELVGRIGYNNGIKGYSETDFEGGPLRFGVALSLATEFDHDDDDVTFHAVSLDGMIKVAGLCVTGAFNLRAIAGNWLLDQDGYSGLNQVGAFVQAGYLIKNLIEPTARYAFVHNPDVDNDLAEEITVGLNLHFFDNHRFQWVNDLSLFMTRNPLYYDAPGGFDAWGVDHDIEFLSQLQVAF